MNAEIGPIVPAYYERVTQLVNKTNQFNLTTRRYTQAQIEGIARNPEYVALYGKLRDRFGDNGLVTVLLARRAGDELHIESWLMSCRVLKRSLEVSMFDALHAIARRSGIATIVGYYLPSSKNGMVEEHYATLGFEPSGVDAEGATVWRLRVSDVSRSLNVHIQSQPTAAGVTAATEGSSDGCDSPAPDSTLSRCAE
jgi:predicted enzyme involved in methoxymalonyl-ACP biosynthesis